MAYCADYCPIALVLRPREQMDAKYNSVKFNFFINRRAWLLASYFGLANGGYACMIAWLPSYARSLGWSAHWYNDYFSSDWCIRCPRAFIDSFR